MIRKMHLGKCLENNDWKAIRNDLKKYPVEGHDENSEISAILLILQKYGIISNGVNETDNENNSAERDSSFNEHDPVTINLWGSGTPYREFLYVDDLAEACVFVMNNVDFDQLVSFNNRQSNSDKIISEIRNTHINIGTGKDLTIKELADTIKKIVGFRGKLHWDSSKPDGTFRKLLDVSKLKSMGWNEKVSLEDGITAVYNQYKS
jgi:GDP-L-fucose synthase